MKKTLASLVLGLASFLPTSSKAATVLYDDFSSGVLDTNKWEESTFHGDPLTDEHNVQNGVYHIQQNNMLDAETNLTPRRQFVSGETLSYDLIYNGGTGNHFSQPLINGNYPPTQLEPCNASGGCGPIGFWNGVPDLEAQVGTYHITQEFLDNIVRMTAVLPDNSVVVNNFTGNSTPYTFTFNTHTGHNGLLNFDIDNVYITEIPEPSTLALVGIGIGALSAGSYLRRKK